jgi:hypothetical protein
VSRKLLGVLGLEEIHRDYDGISELIGGELHRLVPVAIEPFAHGGHLARKIRHAQPYCGGVRWTPKMRQLAKVEPCP